MPFSSLSDVLVVVRYTNEQSYDLCVDSLLQIGFSSDQIKTVSEVPFSLTLRKGFELLIENISYQWLFCVDADIIFHSTYARQFLVSRTRWNGKIAVALAFVADKILGQVRVAGNHLYRRSCVGDALSFIPEEGLDIRPESYVINRLKHKNHQLLVSPAIIGLHDYFQAPADLFRKAWIHSYKYLDSGTPHYINYWRESSKSDSDFKAIMHGFAAGFTNPMPPLINSQVAKVVAAESNFFMEPSSPPSSLTLDQIQIIIASSIHLHLNVVGYPYYCKLSRPSRLLSILTVFKLSFERRNVPRVLFYYINSFLSRFS
ncbi:hypothetical protein [Synechococcus sp. KORDI-49]|uniref:hypothetical protein n=1 Tax=Synechococcus sp. KORDI-49 TaxID=585423 RepID=UPI0012EC4C5E|nr:hypothetical protein [Synechococcus sp. KORDI-49]